MRNSVPEAVLANLHGMVKTSVEAFKTAPWLHSSFTDDIWLINIDKKRIKLDWNKALGPLLLAGARREELLTIFKCWVLLPAHPRLTGGRIHRETHVYQQVRRIIALIDYMLLNQKSLGLAHAGLREIVSNDFRELLRVLHEEVGFNKAIYRWPERLASWLDELAETHRSRLAETVRNNRVLREMHTAPADWELAPNKRTLIRWRAALWAAGYYRSIGNADFTYSIDTKAIARQIFANTLHGVGWKPLFIELGVAPTERCIREKAAVPVQASGGIPLRQDVGKLVGALKSLELLSDVCQGIPVAALKSAIAAGAPESVSFREPGRFATAPFVVIMKNVKNGAEFCYRHGEHIVESYAAIHNAAKETGLSIIELTDKYGLDDFLHPDSRRLGVQLLSAGLRAQRLSNSFGCTQSSVVREYFSAFRGNKGLIELTRVLVGSLANSVGPLTARRSAELVRLPVSAALDSTRTNLVFYVGKSGVLDFRRKVERPVPKLISDEIAIFEHLHRAVGTYESGLLFDVPGSRGMRPSSKTTFNICLDTFTDYFEGDCDANGRRWYIRQHQNRRFLVLAFYYGTTYGNVHALRWMLAHGDPEHLWHYLTNTVPGDIMREVQAYFLVDFFKNHPFEKKEIDLHEDAMSQLAEAMQRTFGSKNFDVVQDDVLEKFINGSIKKGMSVLPHFFQVGGRNIARIAVTVKPGVRL